MKMVGLAGLLFICATVQAEFRWAEVGVEGLTCSMCARSVELKVRKLDFVEDVQMNLSTTTMRVILKEGTHVNIEAIARAVDDAGFSVGYLNAGYVFDEVEVDDGYCLVTDDLIFSFVRTGSRKLHGETTLKFVGEPFLPRKELAEWKPELKSACEQTGTHLCFVTVL
jgi:copper chaperone CopZ